jgi:hypothetical protein
MTPRTLALALLPVLLAAPAVAAPMRFTRIGQDQYQSFVVNWAPPDAPLCAVIATADEWRAVFHPAPTMGASKPFAPDPSFWRTHRVLLVARVTPGGGDPFASPAVARNGARLTVSYALRPPSRPASFMGKSFLALATARSAPSEVTVLENGHAVCALHPAAGAWVTPPLPAPGS